MNVACTLTLILSSPGASHLFQKAVQIFWIKSFRRGIILTNSECLWMTNKTSISFEDNKMKLNLFLLLVTTFKKLK